MHDTTHTHDKATWDFAVCLCVKARPKSANIVGWQRQGAQRFGTAFGRKSAKDLPIEAHGEGFPGQAGLGGAGRSSDGKAGGQDHGQRGCCACSPAHAHDRRPAVFVSSSVKHAFGVR
eukprot:357794-Chlamydomonas_euryale.AAC.13